jgi:hypothetical protein
LLRKKRERYPTKKYRRIARGPREEDQVGEDFPQPSNRGAMASEANSAYSTSIPEIPVL